MRSYYSFEFSKSIEQLFVQPSLLLLLLTIVLTKKKARVAKMTALQGPDSCIKKKTAVAPNTVLLLPLLPLLLLLYPALADYGKLV